MTIEELIMMLPNDPSGEGGALATSFINSITDKEQLRKMALGIKENDKNAIFIREEIERRIRDLNQ